MKPSLWAIVFAFLLSLGPITARAVPDPNFGRFLRTPANSSIVFSYYQRAPLTYDRPVFCSGANGNVNCGTVRFDYATYLAKPGGTTNGGAALSGGFYINPSLMLAPGDRLAWVQVVTTTFAGGTNAWGISSTMRGPYEYPDASRTSPRYPFETTAATPPNPPGRPTLGFQDFPDRRFARGPQSWLAELGLVCIDGMVGGVTQAYVIGTLTWGFTVQTNPNRIATNFPSFTDPFFSAPSASYLATLNSYYSGKPPVPPTSGGTSSMFNFQAGCDNCFIRKVAAPEPAAWMLFAVGLLGVLLSRRFGAIRV